MFGCMQRDAFREYVEYLWQRNVIHQTCTPELKVGYFSGRSFFTWLLSTTDVYMDIHKS